VEQALEHALAPRNEYTRYHGDHIAASMLPSHVHVLQIVPEQLYVIREE
jgi:hypothetical protein